MTQKVSLAGPPLQVDEDPMARTVSLAGRPYKGQEAIT